ncbi:pyrroline-5-carboxylate reductase [Gallibacter sp. Marseille-QA0791]|uniref:pyrroline-5-carboxylate reductase n=1 Tax=Gallibacter sp. Marseille-QA0791 TaxID=3378781 RepID=UPI003D102534
MRKIGFIGIGNMGGAILAGYASSGKADGKELLAFDMNEDLCRKTVSNIPELVICENGKALCEAADTVILGVKPQVIETVLQEIKDAYRADKTVISMAAGVDISVIERYLGKDARIIRIMPNTPAKVGEGMIAMCRNGNVDDGLFDEATEIFSGIGRAEHVDESLIDCVIGVSGSSPAYTYMYIEALIDAAVANGMDAEKARVFAAQSVLGAAKMVLESDQSVEQLRINVCSPNGTTIEAVNKLFENGFMDDVKEGFQAAVDRSIEMGKEKR